MRGATVQSNGKTETQEISIHAPHAGCDVMFEIMPEGIDDFNPRTPCGVRLRFYPKK